MPASRDEKPARCPLLDGDLEPWVRCCTRRFLPLARRVAGGDEHAHDALHTSWVIVLEKLYQYQGKTPACGWVAAIVRHEACTTRPRAHGSRRCPTASGRLRICRPTPPPTPTRCGPC